MGVGFGAGLGLFRCGSWLAGLLGLGKVWGEGSYQFGLGLGAFVKMGWCFRWGWVGLGWIWGGVLDWGIVKNHHTLFFYSTGAYFVPSNDK